MFAKLILISGIVALCHAVYSFYLKRKDADFPKKSVRWLPSESLSLSIAIFIVAQIIGLFLFLIGISLYSAIITSLSALSMDGFFASFQVSFRRYIDLSGSGLFESNPFAGFVQVLCIEVVTLGLLWLFLRRRKISFGDLGINTPALKYAGYALVGFVVYFVLYIIGLSLIKVLVPGLNIEQKQEIGFSTTTSGISLIPIFISLVILPPITEEIVARGFLFGGLRSKLPFVLAAMITSTLFASAHLSQASDGLLWVAGIDTFILSMVLCYLREKTGSLWPSIGVHMIKNGVAFLVLFNIVHYFR